ncbi:SH3 type 3 domain protein [Sulfuricella denitrificans skB26]|uniref:SH3 type 3 domain protein n=2 Tax=Sulfuricella denitrificans TaxID=649841 RepID=S6AD41_SULDS|nr:SH3 type 3 domain protein [Sulfuricella denitrificans skB26]
MHSTRYLHILLAAVLLAAPIAHAGESGTAVKADELKAEPFRDAKTVGKLTAGDKVEILKKDGGWFQVKSARGNGWVRMLSIRRGVARKTSTSSEISGLAGLASGRAGTGRVVATTGIRGLNEEELKAAKYNEAELKLAESSLTSRAEAKKFASKGKLTARKLDYLPDPAEGEQP